MNNELSANMLSSVIKDLEAIELKATTTIQMILFNSVGIAEYTNVLDEIITWAQKGADARDAKLFLIDKFTTTEIEKGD
jgi:hypothetical protein|tara:strand:- start:34 stop:270 length:237 start_codon:yes stop_codon:yes gene_type:complete